MSPFKMDSSARWFTSIWVWKEQKPVSLLESLYSGRCQRATSTSTISTAANKPWRACRGFPSLSWRHNKARQHCQSFHSGSQNRSQWTLTLNLTFDSITFPCGHVLRAWGSGGGQVFLLPDIVVVVLPPSSSPFTAADTLSDSLWTERNLRSEKRTGQLQGGGLKNLNRNNSEDLNKHHNLPLHIAASVIYKACTPVPSCITSLVGIYSICKMR